MPAPTGLSISVIDSKTKGVPTAVFRRADSHEFYLHSRFDPLEEARFLVKDVPRRERTLYVVLGFGLRYHVKELLQRLPQSSHIVEMEPDFACLSGRLLENADHQARAWIQNSRLHFIALHNPKVTPIYLADRQVRLRLLSLEMVIHIPSTLTAVSFYRTLGTEILQTFPTSFHSHLNSLDQMLENDLLNFWANLPHSWNAAPVKSLLDKWSGRPLIIVSPGPSLTDALPLLREAKSKALLLATGPAARILMAEQIRPDLVLSLDPYEANLAHFKGWDTADVPLVYYHRINRGIPALYSGPKIFFAMQDEPPIPMSRSSERSDFWRGGSVAFSALQLAHYLEANPIIFVGQDFAFAGGHTHARGFIGDQAFDTKALPKDYFMVPGIDGSPVVTSRIYHAYLLYMENYLLDFARLKPGVKHINTSRIGAMIRGMDYLALEQALATLAAPAQLSPRESITAALEQNQRILKEAQTAALKRWETELDHLLAQADKFKDFDRLFARFKATSVYAQAPRSYGDIYYLYETRYRGANNQLHLPFLNRFKKHLQSVLEELRKIRAAA